ncbi:MAG: hypothetical protein ACYC61_09505 [Isosphaeraceae bacterium]
MNSAGRDGSPSPRAGTGAAAREPRRTWLSRIIGRGPAERKRLAEAVAALLGTALVAIAAIGGLVIWHLIRRGRLIRERQAPPRIVQWPVPNLPDEHGEPHADDHNHRDDAVSPP